MTKHLLMAVMMMMMITGSGFTQQPVDPDPISKELPLPEAYRELPVAVAAIPEVVSAHNALQKNWQDKILPMVRPRLTSLRSNYQKAVAAEAIKTRANGDLKVAKALQTEADNVAKGNPVGTPDPANPNVGKLDQMQQLYHKTKDKIVAESLAAARKKLLADFDRQLLTIVAGLKPNTDREAEAGVIVGWTLTLQGKPSPVDLSKVQVKPRPLPPLVMIKDPRSPIRKFNDLTNQFPMRLNLLTKGKVDPDQLKVVNEELRKESNRLVRWMVDLGDKDLESPLYASTHYLKARSSKFSFGGTEFTPEVWIYYRGAETFQTKVKGNTFEIAGRLAWTRLTEKDGGTWILHIANAQLISDVKRDTRGHPQVPGIPELKITGASWGTGGSRADVKPVIVNDVIYRHAYIWANPAHMKCYPAPYYIKYLAVSYELGGQARSLHRHENSGLGIEDFYR